jgi:hypothetical protein
MRTLTSSPLTAANSLRYFVMVDDVANDMTVFTRLGTLQLRIPKLRQGSYFPPFLEARKGTV